MHVFSERESAAAAQEIQSLRVSEFSSSNPLNYILYESRGSLFQHQSHLMHKEVPMRPSIKEGVHANLIRNSVISEHSQQ